MCVQARGFLRKFTRARCEHSKLTMSIEVVYGFHTITALVNNRPKALLEVAYDKNRDDKRLVELVERLEDLGVELRPTDRSNIEKLFPDEAHQGIMAKVRTLEPFGEKKLEEICIEKEKPFFLILDGITDPRNLGACLRTADACAVDAIIIPKDRSASLNQAGRKVSCGASEVIPVVKVTNLARTLRKLQDLNIWIVGTAGEAEKDIYETSFPDRGLALVMGNEGTGMRRLTREHCDELVKIPMLGSVSSLNVSVATGVCLFEIVRQKQYK